MLTSLTCRILGALAVALAMAGCAGEGEDSADTSNDELTTLGRWRSPVAEGRYISPRDGGALWVATADGTGLFAFVRWANHTADRQNTNHGRVNVPLTGGAVVSLELDSTDCTVTLKAEADGGVVAARKCKDATNDRRLELSPENDQRVGVYPASVNDSELSQWLVGGELEVHSNDGRGVSLTLRDKAGKVELDHVSWKWAGWYGDWVVGKLRGECVLISADVDVHAGFVVFPARPGGAPLGMEKECSAVE